MWSLHAWNKTLLPRHMGRPPPLWISPAQLLAVLGVSKDEQGIANLRHPTNAWQSPRREDALQEGRIYHNQHHCNADGHTIHGHRVTEDAMLEDGLLQDTMNRQYLLIRIILQDNAGSQQKGKIGASTSPMSPCLVKFLPCRIAQRPFDKHPACPMVLNGTPNVLLHIYLRSSRTTVHGVSCQSQSKPAKCPLVN